MTRFISTDYKVQEFYKQQFLKEQHARIENYRVKKGDEKLVAKKLPPMPADPLEFAIKAKIAQDENDMRIKKECVSELEKFKTAMKAVDSKDKNLLYDGFSAELRGRYQYLNKRKDDSPEEKYNYPVVSSWQYGWNANKNDEDEKETPRFARYSLIKNTFHTRNGVL